MGAHPPDSTAGPAGGRLGADLAAHVEAIVHAAEREARAAERAIAEHRRSAEEEARRYLAASRLHVDAERAAHAARVETLSAATRRLADELADAVTALKRELAGERDADAALPRPPWPAAPPAAPTPPPAAPAPEPSWSRIADEPAAEPRTAEPQPAAATADRAGGAGEDDSATPVAESPRAATGPARSSAEPEHAETNGATEIPIPSAARLVAIEMAVGGSSRAEVEEHLRAQLGVGEPQELLDDVFGTASHAGSRLAWGEP